MFTQYWPGANSWCTERVEPAAELNSAYTQNTVYKLSLLPSHMLLRDEENDFVCVEIIPKS